MWGDKKFFAVDLQAFSQNKIPFFKCNHDNLAIRIFGNNANFSYPVYDELKILVLANFG